MDTKSLLRNTAFIVAVLFLVGTVGIAILSTPLEGGSGTSSALRRDEDPPRVELNKSIGQSRVLHLERNVETLAEMLSDGIAVGPSSNRWYRYGDIFGSSGEDAVVLFTLVGFGGSNAFSQYLAFFEAVERNYIDLRRTRPYRLVAVQKIGAKGWRQFDAGGDLVVGPGFATLSGRRYVPGMGFPWPDDPIRITFSVKNSIITESDEISLNEPIR